PTEPRIARALPGREQTVPTDETTPPIAPAAPEVRTNAGVVRGRWERSQAVFRGIPFAASPVGDARFAAPQPVRPWPGVREAVAFGPPPPQDPGVFQAGAQPSESATFAADDTWLTVNVWTPDPAGRRPVMVWLYGGGYQIGSADTYDAHELASAGDLV